MNKSKIFTTAANEPFFPTLVEYIFAKYEPLEIAKLSIIVPYKADIPLLFNAFKKCNLTQTIILPNIISFEGIDEEHLILNIDKIKVISPIRRILLLTEFIIQWNKNHQFPISIAYNLASLLDEMQHSQIPISALYDLCSDDFAQYWQKTSKFLSEFAKAWSDILQNEKVIDILEHKSNYIKNRLFCNEYTIFAGIHPSKICHTLIKAVYNLEFGLIVLPNLDLCMMEEDWNRISEEHFQYHLKSLLDNIGVNRKDVRYLTTTPKISNKLIEYVFDLSKNLSDFDEKESTNNFEIITCQSQEEEAQIISMIIKSEGIDNVSLFISDQLLFKRVNSLLHACGVNLNTDKPDLHITFLLYILDVLASDWGSIELLSLLKHPFIDLGYSQDEYNKILVDFEIKILRNLYNSGMQEIKKSVDSYNCSEISSFFSKIEHSFMPLIDAMEHNILDIAKAHVECVQGLSKINFLGNEIGSFMVTLIQECQKVEISTLELYQKILSLLLQNKFTSMPNNLGRFSLYKNKVIILTNFNEKDFPPDFQNLLLNSFMCKHIGLPSIETKQGYFQYILHNLLHAEKVYITRSIKGTNGINRKPILLQRLEMLISKSGCALNKQPFREWLKLLSKPDLIIPCSRPKPKPSVDIRSQKLQILSPTAIEKLIRNPYSFYAEYVLNFKPLRELIFMPTVLHFGIIVHKILERYLLSNKTGYESLLDIARKEFFYMHFSNVQFIWWPKFQKIAKNFIRLDTERRKNFHAVEVEKLFFWPLSEKITIKAKCDRVEHLLDESIAIIDYKTGSLPTQSDIEMCFSPQLILQALTAMYSVNKEIRELMYWKFDCNQIGVFSIANYKEIMNFFSANIESFLSSFLDKNTPFAASYNIAKSFKYDHYRHLERRAEWI